MKDNEKRDCPCNENNNYNNEREELLMRIRGLDFAAVRKPLRTDRSCM
jgi:hypothetical protein